jgi:hypothetical protein
VDGTRIVGLVLLVVGGAALLAVTTGIGGEVVVAAVGIAFLASYAATRTYGLLIPGGILTGLGTGIVVASQGGPDAAVPFGLGVGFLLIALIDGVHGTRQGGWWWPLIPGGILATVGLTELLGARDAGAYIVPAVLILVGLALLVRRTPARPTGPGHQASG